MPSNTEIVRTLYDAFERRDLATVFSLISPGIKAVQSPALPWGGEYSGHDGLRQFLTKLTEHVDSRVELERCIDAGEHVVAIGNTHGTVRANGRPFHVSIAHVWQIQAGKIVRFHPYIENFAMLDALNAAKA